ncbi:MAG: hypothetical protein JNK82_11685 [Myxococcaceae bacterium]|nr:hypothetical protein [Myxococcaceae bacterium]
MARVFSAAGGLRRSAAALALLLVAACKKEPVGPVCGLHSASAPVTVDDGNVTRTLGVGAKLLPGDHLKVQEWAVLECFGGALRVLHKTSVDVRDLPEATVEAATLPRRALQGGKVVEVEALARTIAARYSTNKFTPESALAPKELTSGDYFKAFFTPNGFDKLGHDGPPLEGPRNLPAPAFRTKVPYIHAGDLGEGEWLLEVEDDAVFAETDDLATAALVEGKTYELGRTVRLLLPDGAEAELTIDGKQIELDGPMDLKLR